ncbi:hypothetical protein VNO77_44166 [Canavalia gladiata]|uniref:Uncharacterized protein n=1 Tax=Canavalia gladiata TaxID=3824 RepID=A0AAN9JVF4_CANGL
MENNSQGLSRFWIVFLSPSAASQKVGELLNTFADLFHLVALSTFLLEDSTFTTPCSILKELLVVLSPLDSPLPAFSVVTHRTTLTLLLHNMYSNYLIGEPSAWNRQWRESSRKRPTRPRFPDCRSHLANDGIEAIRVGMKAQRDGNADTLNSVSLILVERTPCLRSLGLKDTSTDETTSTRRRGSGQVERVQNRGGVRQGLKF